MLFLNSMIKPTKGVPTIAPQKKCSLDDCPVQCPLNDCPSGIAPWRITPGDKCPPGKLPFQMICRLQANGSDENCLLGKFFH